MLFFNCLTKKCKDSFDRNGNLLRRSRSYKFFDGALEKYLQEVDIVKLILDLRYLKKATKELMRGKPNL